MSPAGALGTGFLCALPVTAVLAFRYLVLRGGMDDRAGRGYLRKASLFSAASLAAGSLIAALGSSLALPAHWALAVAASAVALLARALRTDGR